MAKKQPGIVGQRVRSARDGQVGFVVERPAEEGGGLGVRLDRRAENIVYPYSESGWVPDEAGRLTKHQIARVAYEADRALRAARGEYGVKDWQQLPETTRIAYAGPKAGDSERTALHEAIMGALS